MELGWEKFRTGIDCLFIEKKELSFRKTSMVFRKAGKKQNMTPMWKKLMKNVDLDEPTSFLDHVYLVCTQRECKPNEIVIDEKRKMFESRISARATEKYRCGRNLTRRRSRGLTTWKDMLKTAFIYIYIYCELANKKTGQ